MLHGKAVCPFVGAKVIEPDTGLRHDFMSIRRRHLAKIKRVSYHKVMNAVGTAKVETKQLEWPQPPRVHYLGLLQGIARRNIAIIVHVGTYKEQAELPYHIGCDKNNHCMIDDVH